MRGAYSLVACLSHLTVDLASLSRAEGVHSTFCLAIAPTGIRGNARWETVGGGEGGGEGTGVLTIG